MVAVQKFWPFLVVVVAALGLLSAGLMDFTDLNTSFTRYSSISLNQSSVMNSAYDKTVDLLRPALDKVLNMKMYMFETKNETEDGSVWKEEMQQEGEAAMEEQKESQELSILKNTTASEAVAASRPLSDPLHLTTPSYENISKQQSDIINPFDYNYIYNPKDRCASGNVKTVFCVPFTPDLFTKRQKYRDYNKTGHSVSVFTKDPANQAIMIFFLGTRTYDSEIYQQQVERQIFEEVSKFNDIVQMDFRDSYRNLTLKTMSILKWVSTYCKNATFAIKTDPDVSIHPHELVEGMERQYKKLVLDKRVDSFIIGRIGYGEGPIRHPRSKWYVSRSLYAEKKYPAFAHGPTYGMTVSAAEPLFNASIRMPYFYLEDVAITGLCAHKMDILRTETSLFKYKH